MKAKVIFEGAEPKLQLEVAKLGYSTRFEEEISEIMRKSKPS